MPEKFFEDAGDVASDRLDEMSENKTKIILLQNVTLSLECFLLSLTTGLLKRKVGNKVVESN